MTTTTPQRIGGWLLGPLAWLLVALLSGVVAVYRCVIFSANISNARRTSTDDTNLMGRFFYYRYRHVVLHTVVDHRFL
mgnify:FL=1